MTCKQPDGTIVEGVVDLAFAKTGYGRSSTTRPIEIESEGEDRYRRQIALYATAIAQATGSRATGVLLRI